MLSGCQKSADGVAKRVKPLTHDLGRRKFGVIKFMEMTETIRKGFIGTILAYALSTPLGGEADQRTGVIMAENVVSLNTRMSTPLAEPAPRRRRSDQSALELVTRLQSSLEPERVLEIFFVELRARFGLCGMRWRDEAGQQRLDLGRLGRHRVVYRLKLSDAGLGELVLSRRSGFPERELAAIEQLIGLVFLPLRNAVMYQEALAAARHDPLTGLGNRVALQECLAREIDLGARHDESLAMMVLDVDEFKTINDRYGHSAGDAVLRTLADVLRRSSRQSDLLFRFAGDEFVILMSRTDLAGGARVGERVREAVQRETFGYGGQLLPVRVSLGVALAAPGETAASLFDRADHALLSAKRDGRNRVAVAP